MKLPAFLSNILKLVNKQHIGLRVVLYVALIGCAMGFLNWFQSTMVSQGYGLEGFGQGKELVLFHWNKCGHCKKMMPEWQKTKSSYKGSIKLVDYESEKNPKIMKDNGIQGYPTLKLFNNGKVEAEYEGPRTAQGFIAFLNKHK